MHAGFQYPNPTGEVAVTLDGTFEYEIPVTRLSGSTRAYVVVTPRPSTIEVTFWSTS